MAITQQQLIAWLKNSAAALKENKAYLTDLDAAIGDADHGINMDRGFSAIVQKLDGWGAAPIDGLMKSAAMTLMSTVGGVSGPLYGTFFMRFAASAGATHELGDLGLLQALRAGVEGIVQRGRAQEGDKTMIDAWAPALRALEAAFKGGLALKPALEQAVKAASAGAEATVPLQARKGRASYLGERSIGHKDPGAASSLLLLQALLSALG